MSRPSPERIEAIRRRRQILLNHIAENAKGGRAAFYKTKHLAKDAGLSSVEVGHYLTDLSRGCAEYDVELWSRGTHVWRVAPREASP
ncbi:MAG: hypothetical protein WC683_15090 [bacterium]